MSQTKPISISIDFFPIPIIYWNEMRRLLDKSKLYIILLLWTCIFFNVAMYIFLKNKYENVMYNRKLKYKGYFFFIYYYFFPNYSYHYHIIPHTKDSDRCDKRCWAVQLLELARTAWTLKWFDLKSFEDEFTGSDHRARHASISENYITTKSLSAENPNFQSLGPGSMSFSMYKF